MSASITGIRLPADRDRPPEVITFRARDLSLVQGIVGGLIEAVSLVEPAGTLWVNEEGLALGLPVNLRASLLARAANPARKGVVLPGNALLVGPADAQGRGTSVAPEYRAVLLDDPARVRVDLVSTDGERRVLPVDGAWRNPFVAYAEGLHIAAAFPELAVRLRPA